MTSDTRRAFARTDLLAGATVAAVALTLMFAAAQQTRKQAMAASSLSQLHWIAGATTSYAADNADRYWNFSWTVATTPPTYPVPASDYVAQGYQAVDILRRRGRPDMPTIFGWIPHVGYSHLVLVDYLDRDIPDFNFISPADKHQTAWARDPAAFDAGAFLPLQPDPTDVNKRWPYRSSFEQPPAFYDQSDVVNRIGPGSTQAQYIIPGGVTLGAWRVADVTHPSQKSHISDTADRMSPEDYYFLDERADVPILMADSSASMRRTADSNVGWNPRFPTSLTTARFSYDPRAWDPQGTIGVLDGHYRWTRGGIEGRDFGGPEVDTGQP